MAAVAAMFLTACTGNKIAEDLDFEKATPEAVVSALAEKVQAGDATAISAALETVQTQLSKLVDATPLTKVIDQVAALPGAAVDEAQSAAEDAVEGAVDEAQDAVEGAVDAVEGAVNDAVDAANKAANDAVEAGKAAVEEGKAKTNEAIQNAADKIKL